MASFYDRVYDIVRGIPPGRVTTYGLVAALCGQPLASRAVGYALRALPPETDVPWQRVINKQGRISPRGQHDRAEPCRQRMLLEREGVAFDEAGAIDLRRFGWEGPLAPEDAPE
jgi:methylated-DNA-protein-cysteine methyltransferase-like protein